MTQKYQTLPDEVVPDCPDLVLGLHRYHVFGHRSGLLRLPEEQGSYVREVGRAIFGMLAKRVGHCFVTRRMFQCFFAAKLLQWCICLVFAQERPFQNFLYHDKLVESVTDVHGNYNVVPWVGKPLCMSRTSWEKHACSRYFHLWHGAHCAPMPNLTGSRFHPKKAPGVHGNAILLQL